MDRSVPRANTAQQDFSTENAALLGSNFRPALKWGAILAACMIGACNEKPENKPSPPPPPAPSSNPVPSQSASQDGELFINIPDSTQSLVPLAVTPVMPMSLTDRCVDVQLLPEHRKSDYLALTRAAMVICQLDPQVGEIVKDKSGAVITYLLPLQVQDYVSKLTNPETGKGVADTIENGKDASALGLYFPKLNTMGHYIFIDILANNDFPQIIGVLNHELWHVKRNAMPRDPSASPYTAVSSAEEVQVIDDSIASLTRIMERLRSSPPVMDAKADRDLIVEIEKYLTNEREQRAKLSTPK